MTDTVVLIPVLNRPRRAAPVVESVLATSDADVLFVASDDDTDELAAVRQLLTERVGLLLVEGPGGQPGDYARKINAGLAATEHPWLFQGADDLRFHPGWQDACLSAAAAMDAGVVGTVDRCNPRTSSGKHSTHSLVARWWTEQIGTLDRKGVMLHEGYDHNFCDDELVLTAKLLRRFAFARDAVVEHLHPYNGHPMDATYERALDKQRFTRDRRTLNTRRRMWTHRGMRMRGRIVGGVPGR